MGLCFRYATIGEGVGKECGGADPLFRHIEGLQVRYETASTEGHLTTFQARDEERASYRFSYERGPLAWRKPGTRVVRVERSKPQELAFEFARTRFGRWVLLPDGDKYLAEELMAIAYEVFDFLLVHGRQILYLQDDGLGDSSKWIVAPKYRWEIADRGKGETAPGSGLQVVPYDRFLRRKTEVFGWTELPAVLHENGDGCVPRERPGARSRR